MNVTRDELRRLPVRAIVAFAVRAARRVQPLFELAANVEDRDRHLMAVEGSAGLTEAWLMGGDSVSLIAYDDYFVYASATHAASHAAWYAAARAARAARTAADAEAGAYGYAAGYAARAARDASYSAAYAEADAAGADDPDAEACAYYGPADTDYERLTVLAAAANEFARQTLDATEHGPLGPLWPADPPAWYVEKKAKLVAELARIREDSKIS